MPRIFTVAVQMRWNGRMVTLGWENQTLKFENRNENLKKHISKTIKYVIASMIRI